MSKITRESLIKILIITFFIQVFIAVLLKFYSFQEIKLRKITKSLLGEFDVTQVASIKIDTVNNSITIEKDKNRWFVNTDNKKIPAELVKVDAFLDIVRNLPEGVVRDRGEDKANETLFGLDKEHYKKVTITTLKKKQYTLFVGSPGVLRGTSYIRVNNEKVIREVKSVISHETVDKREYWIRKRVFDDKLTSALDVERVNVKSRLEWFTGSYSIVYKEKRDQFGNLINDNFELEPPLQYKPKDYELVIMINSLLNITVVDYKDSETINENDIVAEIEIVLRDGKNYKMRLYRAKRGEIADFVAKVDFNNYLYYISSSEVKKFIVRPADLLKR